MRAPSRSVTTGTSEPQSSGRRLRVLVVDDSAVVRKVLTQILESDPQIEVVGTASDPHIARERIKQLDPDVLTLDVEMPRMDGIAFLRNLMRLRPMPVVMVSSLTAIGADVTLDALQMGAVDFVTKPRADLGATLDENAEELIAKVKTAARARITPLPEGPVVRLAQATPRFSADAVLPRASRPRLGKTTAKLIAIGASTGGTEALRHIIAALPANVPGVVVAQHIPQGFSLALARRLDSLSPLSVAEAQDGQPILDGHVYIAAGDRHLMVVREGGRYVCRLSDGPRVNRHRPSVDVLFRSVAQQAGPNAVGVILTGMGDDGAAGLKEMREAGAPTVAQDEASSVVWGMPGEAVRRGGADLIAPLSRIGREMLRLAKGL